MPDSLPRLLFVCVENSSRSQMAEAFAVAHGKGRVAASSAGSKPSGEVDPRAVRLMQEKGIDLSGRRSKRLADLPAAGPWDWIVTMGCSDACPWLPARHRVDWELPDPKTLDDAGYREVRDRIEGLVRGLIGEATAPATGGAKEEEG